MATRFLSPDEYDERAHRLYDEGRYDDALEVLREGLAVYPNAVELHIGLGYARLAREEFAWARRSFDSALMLDPEHEDAMAGLGEVLLRFGDVGGARRHFRRTLDMGYDDDVELMLQIGRALFREGLPDDAREYFEAAVRQVPASAEAVALLGYAQHRLGDEQSAVATLKRALRLDPDHSEARIYLGNLLYDVGQLEAALYHLDRSRPEDHWDELGIWRLIELKRSIHRLPEDHPDTTRWEARLAELSSEGDNLDGLLTRIEQAAAASDQQKARQQLELFGAMLTDLAGQRPDGVEHRILLRDGRAIHGTWDDIVRQMQEGSGTNTARSVGDYMVSEARRGYSLTGVVIPTASAESFIRGSANAGLLRILR